MPKSRYRPRRSFGGRDGVWWRNKVKKPASTSSPSRQDDNQTSEGAEGNKSNINNKEGDNSNGTSIGSSEICDQSPETSNHNKRILAEITWDEDLCRPIYNRSNLVSDECVDDSSDDGGVVDNNNNNDQKMGSDQPAVDESGTDDTSNNDSIMMKDGKQPHNNPTSSTQQDTTSIFPTNGVKRSKTFGSKSRRPLSLVLQEMTDFDNMSSINNNTVSNNDGTFDTAREGGNEEDDYHHKHDDDDDDTTADQIKRKKSASDTSTATVTVSKRTKFKPAAKKALEQAKQYFDELDATQKLVLDSSESNLDASAGGRNGKVTRTTRKMSLSNPQIQQEYKAYATASTESGVPPLTIEEYAQGRRDVFRKNELFDGFLDE